VKSASLAASVIIPAFNAREEIGPTLASLDSQTTEEPFEVIIVASGDDGCADYLREWHPSVRVVESRQRLYPGAARNAGLSAARGEFVAFASADTRASPGWLAARLAVHHDGYDIVGGSILNGTPDSWVGTAGYLLEYSALLPVDALLRKQEVPHALSFRRSLFDLIGTYPEDVRTGEDTLLNSRCIDTGLSIGFAAEAGLVHENPRRLNEFLAHASTHGRGLAQCIHRHDLPAVVKSSDTSTACRSMVSAYRYTVIGLLAKFHRIVRFAPRWVPQLIISTPLIAGALVVTVRSCLSELRLLENRG
jgi:glycosyltransferase involved in cell wall biosynthesis